MFGDGLLKIVIIGAGSHVFARRLIADVLSYPELRNCTISLMDINKEALDLTTAFAKKMIDQHKLCLLYTSPSPRDLSTSRMPSSA